MRILLAGGAGDVGKNISEYLYQQGHTLIILDKKEIPNSQKQGNTITYTTDLMDLTLLKDIVENCDVVVNLAWSFADQPEILFNYDIIGHINLLKACATAGGKSFIYTSTAGVYGTPAATPINEEYCCRPERARKPLYSIAKHCAEQLCLSLGHQYSFPVTVFRFWWAYGKTIGGKHLRELIKLALSGQPLQMVRGAGGAFVSMNDLGLAIERAASNQKSTGNVYNLGSLYLSWEEIAQAIIRLTQSTSQLQLVDAKAWNGPAFLNETWNLNWDKAAKDFGYKPLLSSNDRRTAFYNALAKCIAEVKQRPKCR